MAKKNERKEIISVYIYYILSVVYVEFEIIFLIDFLSSNINQ